MPRKAVQPAPRQGSLDRLMSSKSAVRARLGNDEKVDVDYIEACGAAAPRQNVDSAHGPHLACTAGARAILTVRLHLVHPGDCFYMAVETALAESEGWQPWHAVAAMREVVASQLTEEIFQMYTLLHAQQADGGRLPLPTAARAAARTDLTPRARAAGFDWMQGVDSLEALRKRIRLRGQQATRGIRPSLRTHHSLRTTGVASPP
jgi:hypothetical protein